MAGTAGLSTLTEEEGVKNKAFIKIHGKDMLAYVLQAFRTAKGIGRIAVVAPAAEMRAKAEEDILIVPEGDSLVDNLKKGCLALEPGEHFLVCSSDVPFLTAEAVEDFLAACHPYDYDFYYPIVSRADSERRFPGVKRTYVKIKNAEYTGGNHFWLIPCLPAALSGKILCLAEKPVAAGRDTGIILCFKVIIKKSNHPGAGTALCRTFCNKRKGSDFGISGNWHGYRQAVRSGFGQAVAETCRIISGEPFSRLPCGDLY